MKEVCFFSIKLFIFYIAVSAVKITSNLLCKHNPCVYTQKLAPICPNTEIKRKFDFLHPS